MNCREEEGIDQKTDKNLVGVVTALCALYFNVPDSFFQQGAAGKAFALFPKTTNS
jgi:hypothetical protein